MSIIYLNSDNTVIRGGSVQNLSAAEKLQAQANVGIGPGALSKISPYPLKMATPMVQHKCPIVGESVTIATFTGVGIVEMIWITMGSDTNGTLSWDGCIQVFTDGATLPDIDCDMGTLFLTHLDGHIGTSRAGSTEHIVYGSKGDGGSGMSGGLKFPIPYSNGCVIKFYAPTGSTAPNTDYSLFTQVVNKPGAISNLRLRSNAVTYLNKKTYSASDIITFFNLTNAAGWLVWQSFAILGAGVSGNTYDYLERIWFWGVDGEPTVADGNGVVTTDFSSSGGEDLFLYGWYFVNTKGIYGTPWTLVTATNNTNKTTVAGFDFLAAYGGLKFNSALKPGWSLKPSNVINNGHDMSWCFLYYIDTSVAYVPSSPSILVSPANSGVNMFVTHPTSYGSDKITGYSGMYFPGGTTFTIPASGTVQNISGLNNGTLYTFTLSAMNSVGASIPASGGATPSSVVLPTITSATILAQYTADSIIGLSNGQGVANWTRNYGTAPVNFVQPTVGQRPIYQTGVVNGFPALSFNSGAPQRLIGDANFNLAAPTMEIVVWKPSGTLVTNQIYYTYPAASHGLSAGGINGNGKWNTYAGSADVEHSTSPTSAWHVESMFQNGAGSYVAIDGSKSSTSDAGSGGLDNVLIGSVYPLNGDIAEMIIIQGSISDGDRHSIEVYLGTKYGITIS